MCEHKRWPSGCRLPQNPWQRTVQANFGLRQSLALTGLNQHLEALGDILEEGGMVERSLGRISLLFLSWMNALNSKIL